MEAARLRRRADRRRRNGDRSVFARFALSTLIRAGDRGDQAAVDEVWAMWRSEPDEMLWERLACWRRPARDAGWDPGLRGVSLVALDEGSVGDAAFRTALIEAAVRMDHPIGEIARRRVLAGDQEVVDTVCAAATARPALVPFCVEHGLAPSDPVDGAVFFLLTGQAEHYRAADPDGSLIALGYEAATADVRTRLRTAMVDAGDLDVARILVGTGPRDGRIQLAAGEVVYLTARLAARRAWAEMWRLAQHLPLVDAVTTARLVDGWRPPHDRDRVLFDRLTGADPEPLAEARRDLTTFGVTRIEVPGSVEVGAFSPDGRRLAVLTTPNSRPGQDAISVFDLAGGRLVERYELTPGLRYVLTTTAVRLHVQFVPLGQGLIAANPQLLPGTHDVHSGLRWYSDGHAEEWESRPVVRALVPSPARGGGFVAYTRDGELEFRGPDGDLVSAVRLRAELGPDRAFGTVRALAIEPGSGRLAVAGDGLAVFDARDDAHVRLLAHERLPGSPTIYGAAFLDQDRLVTTDMSMDRAVRRWRLTGNRLDWRTAPAGPAASDTSGPTAGLTDRVRSPIVIPQRGEVAVIDRQGDVRYVDAERLAAIDEPRELTGHVGHQLWAAPGSGLHALGGDGYVDVVSPAHSPAVAALADRPPAEMTPGDLATVSAALRDLSPGSAARPFLELLHDCLEHRFASDVQLGTATPATGGPHDIALADGTEADERPWR
jgi:hypothetical protein